VELLAVKNAILSADGLVLGRFFITFGILFEAAATFRDNRREVKKLFDLAHLFRSFSSFSLLHKT